MAQKKNALGKTLATIIALTTLTLSVATGVVGGHVLNKNNAKTSQPGSGGESGSGGVVRSVSNIEKTNTYGLIDEYTITYTDGTTSIFIVTNGKDGEPGVQGFPGRDGHTPTIEVDENGHWVIDGVATSFVAVGPQGPAGQDGLTPYIGLNGNWWIGETDTGVKAEGRDGEDGFIPLIGANGNWWIGGTDTGVPAQGQPGRSIVSIDKTDSQGLIDVYTITYSDETTSTFLVTNGADGAQGQGVPGQGGYIPEITVENGKWVIDGVPTEYDAVGPQGPEGPQGISIHTGEGEPASTLGRDGDSYINLNNWDYYVMDNGAWVKVGNIHGSNGASVHSGTGDPTTNNVPGNVGDTYIDLSTGDLYEMGQDGWGNPTGNTGVASVEIGANGNWYIGGVDTGISATGPQGPAGNSVFTGAGDPTTGNVPGNAGDTYIDLSTGNVYHMDENGEWGDPDANSTFAIPHIGVNGHWYVGDEDTGINATGPQGASVKIGHGDPTTGSVAGNAGDTYIDLDTGYYYIYDENNGWGEHAGTDAAATCVLTGNGIPTTATGKNGDSYIDLDSWDFYVRDNDAWAKVGNIKGGDGAQGSSVNVGHGDPTTGSVAGHAGDTYIDLETGNYYNYDENNGWGEPIGSGAIGASLRTGTTAPAADLGNNGDSYINTATWDYYVKENGAWVLQSNFAGRDGISISKVERTSGTGAAGTTDTYTITYSDSTQENPHVDTFTVTNGTDGNKIIVGTGAPTDATEANVGDNYIDVETWKLYVKAADTWEDKGSFKGDPGVSIVSVEFKERNALIDVYEITYSDSTQENPHVDTFTVTNGKDGTSVRTGHRDPRAVNDDPTTAVDETLAAVEGIEGDSFIDLDTWNYFVLTDDGEGNLTWNPEGNLHYSPNRYTITFDSNGGSAVDPYEEALEGFTIVVPDAPTQDGYFFQGWYTSEGTRWDFSKDVVTKDTTLTARWGQFIVEDGLIKDCSITSGDIVIPEYYDNQLVIGIADEAFKDKTGITSFTLPHTVKSIGNSAFEGCTGLTSVVIPSNVKSIGQDAFKGCSNVVYVYIEDGAANPGISSFRGPSQSNGLETIGSGAFAGCSSLKGIVLPSTIKSIGKGAFEDCDSLESYTAPFIGGSAEASVSWAYCYGAGEPTTTNPSNNVYLDTESGYIWVKANGEWNKSEMAVPLNMLVNGAPTGSATNGDAVMDIETGNLYAYQNDTWISYMNLLDNPQMANVLSNYVTNATYLSFVFGGSSYDDNNSALPSSLKTVTITGDYAIDTNAMNGCDDIETIIISGNPSSIGFGAFANCYDLKSITLPYIGPDSSYVAPLTYSYGHGEPDTVNPTTTTYFDLDSNHYWQYYNDQWVDLTEEKDDATLDAIASGTGVVIGTEFPSSGGFLNYETGVLYTYYNENWVPFSNLLDYANALPTSNSYLGYIFGANNMENQDSEIPSNLDTIILTGANGDNRDCIPSYAFYGCDAKNIVLPNNVRDIGDYAFGETEITSFVVPNSVEYLGKGVFKDSEISELTLPFLGKSRDTLSVADATLDYLFDNRSNNVETVILTGGNGANRDTIPDFAFTSSKVAKVVIPEGVTKIGAEAFHFCLDLTSISLPSTLKVIGTACFYQTSRLTELNLPQGLARIEAGALADTKCTTIVIPSSVTYIGDRAFRYNSHLKSVVFQDGADKQFGDNVFQDCNALENVYLGHGITKVNNKMFANLKSLKVVALAETITEIGDLAFKNCTSLKSINLPANLESIGIQAFYHCTGLESFVMPNSVTSIGRMAFEGCISLKNLTLSESLETIEVQTFEGCTSLQAVVLPSNLKELGTRTFFGCTSLKYIVLNEGLENISEFAFTGCDSLESIVIPDSVKDIGRGAFSTGLTRKGNLWDTYSPERTEHAIIQVTSTHDLPVAGEIGDIIVFTDADHYGEIWVRYDSGDKWELRDTIVGFELFYNSISPTSIESGKLFINSVDGDLLVEYSSKLNSITLPFIGGSVSSIGDHILSGALANDEKPSDDLGIDNDLYVDTAHSQIFRKINGKWCSQVMFTLENGSVGTMQVGDTDPTGASTNDCYYINTATGMYWLGSDTSWGETRGNVKDIFNSFGYAFVRAGSKHNHDSLNSMVPNTIRVVVICNGAELIDGAFRGFTNIETIVLPKTLVSIGDYAFEGCTSLSLLNLEEGLLSIGDYAFRNTALVNINVPDTVTSLGVRAFELSSSLETVKLGSGLTKVEYGLFNDCSNLKTVILGSGITEIDEYAFYHCSSLEAIAIPTGVTEIKEHTFDGCSSLNYAYIPEGVTDIEQYAFAGCTSLKEIVLPTSVTSIGRSVFLGCNNFESLTTSVIGGVATTLNNAILSGELASDELPANDLGNDGDMYVSTASSKIYRKQNGKWFYQYTICLANTDTPANIYVGTTSPSYSVGTTNDYYIRLTTGDYYIRQSSWGAVRGKIQDGCYQLGYIFIGDSAASDLSNYNAYIPDSFKTLSINSATSIFQKGCLKGVELESMSTPFIGGSATSNNFIGYLWGDSYYYYQYDSVKLKNLEITGDLSIPSNAASGVTTLETVIISGNPDTIGSYAFSSCGLKHIIVSGENTYIENSAFGGCSNAETVTLPLNNTLDKVFNLSTTYPEAIIGTLIITKVSGENNDVIPDYAFRYIGAKTLVLPEGIKTIGNYAFASFYGNETLYIPETVTTIGNYAFSQSEIKSITLPNGVTTIGNYAFSRCYSLESVVLPNSVTSLGSNTFYYCRELRSVVLGDGITTIPNETFYFCDSLKYLKLSDSLTSIGDNAFYYAGLESIYLPRTVQTIGRQAFNESRNLQIVDFDTGYSTPSLTSIGYQAFYHCNSLLFINLQICTNFETMGEQAFAYCRALQNVTLPWRLDVIPERAFEYCSSLTTVQVGSATSVIGYSAFGQCTSLTSFNYLAVREIGSYAFEDCTSLTYLYSTSSNIRLERIDSYAFQYCPIKAVELPKTLTYIGSAIFEYNKSMESLTIPFIGQTRDNPNTGYNGINYLFESYDGLKSLKSIVVTNALTLPNYAFSYCENATTIIINEGCTFIGNQGFYNCYNVQYISLPNSLRELGPQTFQNCKKLQNLILPEGLEMIPRECFYYCYALKEIVLPNTVEYIDSYAFYYSGLESIVCGSGLKTIKENGLYIYNGNLKNIVLNEGLEVIERYAFSYATIESIVIPSTVKEIGDSAFQLCHNLTYVYINEGVEELGDSLFYEAAIKNIVIPNSVKSIGNSCLRDLEKLESVTLPFIGTYPNSLNDTFVDICYDLNHVKTIVVTGDYHVPSNAFQSCDYLETVVFTGNPSSFGSSVFYGCSALSTIVIPYIGAANAIGNIIVDNSDPNEFFWLSTPDGNITNNPNPSVVIYEKYSGDIFELPAGTIVASLETGDVMISVSELYDYEQTLEPYSGSDITFPHIVTSNWYIGDTDTGLPAPNGGFEGIQSGYKDEMILSPTYQFEDDDPWYPFVDVDTFDIYFCQNFDQPMSEWTWAKGGNILKPNVTANVVAFESHDPSWWEPTNMATLPDGTIIVMLTYGEAYVVHNSGGEVDVTPYDGDILYYPSASTVWYIGDRNTNIAAPSSFAGFIIDSGNPRANHVTPDPTRVFISVNTLDMWVVDIETNTWIAAEIGNLKKPGSNPNIVLEENYYDGYFDESYNLHELDQDAIVVSLTNLTARQVVKTDLYRIVFNEYEEDIGYYRPYVKNGYWYVGNSNTGIQGPQYFTVYTGLGDPASNGQYINENAIYIDLDTFNFYLPKRMGENGDIFIDSSSGNVLRRINGEWILESSLAHGTFLSGPNDPLDSEGDDGNYYVNTSSGVVFRKVSGAWTIKEDLKEFFGRMNYYFMVFGGNDVWVPSNLKNITITGDGDVKDSAFKGCKYIETITFTGHPQRIGNNAFKNCTNLQSIAIPDSVTTIGDSAFEGCSLQSIKIGDNVTSIGQNAFANNNGWKFESPRLGYGAPIAAQSFNDGDMYIDLNTGLIYYKMYSRWHQGQFPSYSQTPEQPTTTQYNNDGFCALYGTTYDNGEKKTLYVLYDHNYYNTGLEIYNGMGEPGGGAYENCLWYIGGYDGDLYIKQDGNWVKGSLNHVTCGVGAPTIAGYVDDYYVDREAQTLYRCEGGTTWTLMINNMHISCGYGDPISASKIPDEGTIYIEQNTNNFYRFENNEWRLITDVNMVLDSSISNPMNSVIDMEIGSYYYDTGSRTLYSRASAGLSVISIGKNLNKIADGAFANNRGLQYISIPDTVKYIGFGAFEGCNNLQAVSVPFLGSQPGIIYGYGSAAPTNETDCTIYLDIANSVLWHKVDDQWEQVDAAAYGISDVLAADRGAGAPTSSSANANDLYLDYEKSVWYQYINSNWEPIDSFFSLFPIGSTHFAYIFGGEVFSNQVSYESKVPESLKTVIVRSGLKLGIPNYTEALLENMAFAKCSGIETIVLPKDLAVIGDGAFYGCTSLKNISLPDTLTLICAGAFQECRSLESLVIPDSVETIDEEAFEDCESLTYIKLPNNAMFDYLNESLFANCISLKTLEIPNTVTRIYQYAFKNCSNLESLVIPDSVTYISDYIFDGCVNLKSLVISNSIEIFSYRSLRGCVNLEYLSTPFLPSDYEPSFDYDPALSCSFVYIDPDYSTEGRYALNYTTGDFFISIDEQWRLVYHYDGITNVIDGAPYNYDLPAGTHSVGTLYTYLLNNQRVIRVLTDQGWTDPFFVEYNYLGSFFGGDNSAVPSSLKNVTITGEQNHSHAYAFYGCSSLETVSLPSSWDKVDNGMFNGCTSLHTVVLGDNLTEIGESAFEYCESLRNIKLPDTLVSIGKRAFSECASLVSIDLPSSITTINEYTFSECANLISLGENHGFMDYIGDYAFAYCEKLTRIPDAERIGDYAFTYCQNIKYLYFEGTKEIGKSAFEGCYSLVAIEIEDTIDLIDSGAFANCVGLSSIAFNISGSVKVIGGGAFTGCRSLASINLPNGLLEVGMGAFQDCSNLRSIVIPNTTTAIRENAFTGCRSLETLTVPFVGVYPTGNDVNKGKLFIMFGGWDASVIPATLRTVNVTGDSVGVLYNGYDAPEASVGRQGDAYYDSSAQECYVKTAAGWESVGSGFEYDLHIENGEWYNGYTATSKSAIRSDSTVTTIYAGAFYNCTNIQYINIGDGITTLENGAFRNCSNLREMILPAALTTVGNRVFEGCNWLATIYYGGSEAQWNAMFANMPNDNGMVKRSDNTRAVVVRFGA